MTTRKMTALVLGSLMLLPAIFSTEPAYAKRTAEEQAAKDAAKATKKQSRIRLEAKFNLDEVAGDEATEVANGRELYVRFRSQNEKNRIDAEASNFEVGTQLEVFVGDVSLGVITVEDTGAAIEGELGFRDADWPQGLPTTITVGTIVRFVDAAGAVVAEGPMIAD